MLDSSSVRDAAVSIAAAGNGVSAVLGPDALYPAAHGASGCSQRSGTLSDASVAGRADDVKSMKLWRLAAVGALVCTPAVLQVLGLPVVPGKWVSWSHQLAATLARHLEMLKAGKGRPSSAVLHRVVALLAPLAGPVLLTCRTFSNLLLWRALLRPETWMSFALNRCGNGKPKQPIAEPQSEVHECFSLISASVVDSPQRAHSSSMSRLGDSASLGSSEADSDCVDAMLQFASIGCSEPQPVPWWQVPEDE